MHSWTLLPGGGLRQNKLEVRFGKSRDELRKALVPLLGAPSSYQPNEDDYADSSLRLRFDDANFLSDIEVMGGQLQHEGIELFATNFATLEAALTKRYGHEPKWNHMLDRAECPELGLSFASRFNLGGDLGEDAIAWVMLQPIAKSNEKKP